MLKSLMRACLASMIVLASASSTLAASAPYQPGTVIAEIDGKELTLEDVMFRWAALPQDVRLGYESQPDGMRAFVDDLIANLLVTREAVKAGLDKDPRLPRLVELEREKALRDLYARTTLLKSIDDKVLRARYEEEKQRFTVEARSRLRLITVTPVDEKSAFNDKDDDAVGEDKARAKAEQLRTLITEGKAFDEVARSYSEEISAGVGGALGWVDAGTLVPELAQAARSLPVGQLSPVIRSQLGFHLVLVEERREAGTIPFEVVRELLLQEEVGNRRADLVRAAREERARLLKAHTVVTHPDRLPW